MRTFDDIEHRWSTLWGTSIGVDLREAIRDTKSTFDPCEEGLRSICWRAFLLYGPLSTGSWTKKIAESRSAYASLRDHFLKYINNPNDLHSSTDPLADDESSPWSSLRQDESSREEIFQDITRCMQDNYFFREPTTQKKLLDILFIYSKLNPDTGYRQGMHELLAPILWVVYQDAIDLSRVPQSAKDLEGADLMLEVLDKKYIEHDAFSLFCAVMQTAKSFYELGENRDSSAIVAQSDRIHNDLLMATDPDLSRHLTIIGVLPQIYSIRWIRLLFGREFDFKDVLKMWDLLFAENLTLEIIDMTCVAMLLRVRWQLIDADYTTVITNLSHFQLPTTQAGPRSLVRDATFLQRNKSIEGGATIIQNHSGKRPKAASTSDERPYSPNPLQIRQSHKRWSQVDTSSPARSPARSGTPQKQLESIFQEVSGNLQRQVEGWSVSKVVRGAVGEVRRNVSNLQATHLRGPSFDTNSTPDEKSVAALEHQVRTLEMRNKALAKMLDGALNSLRACKSGSNSGTGETEDAFNVSLAKIQFVSVYLADSEIPIPSSEADIDDAREGEGMLASKQNNNTDSITKSAAPEDTEQSDKNETTDSMGDCLSQKSPDVVSHTPTQQAKEASAKPNVRNVRPTLADSSFSFMLGENRHRSSFVTSVSTLPEQRRNSNSQHTPQPTGIEAKDKKDWKERKDRKEKPERKEQRREDDGFTLSSFE